MIGLQNCKDEIAENFVSSPKNGKKKTLLYAFFFFFFFFLSRICDRLCDFGPYGGTWAKLGFLHNLTCSYVLSILVNF